MIYINIFTSMKLQKIFLLTHDFYESMNLMNLMLIFYLTAN